MDCLSISDKQPPPHTHTQAETQFSLISAMGPAFRLLDPETTHTLGIEAAKLGMFPKETRPDPAILGLQLWNKQFKNPIGEASLLWVIAPGVFVLTAILERFSFYSYFWD